MRTTTTLDDDVMALLREAQRRRRATFKQVINDAIRAGLAGRQPAARGAFRTRVVSLGRPLLPSLDDVSEAIELTEAGWRP